MTTVKSWQGVAVGLVIALVVPISFLVIAKLVEIGLAPQDQVHATMGALTAIALSEVLLGPIGIVIAGRSAGARSVIAWLAVMIVSVPVVAFVWFVGVATLSGALGDPF